MNTRSGRRWGILCGGLAVLLAVFSACTDASNDSSLEVAAELRALRLALQQAPRTSAPAVAVPDRAALATALAPLHEVMDGLHQEQKELQLRQQALLQELQRWSQLLAQTVTGQSRADAEALGARLQQVEAQLKAQDERHQKVEAMLGGVLDRTADRLEDFLKRLEGIEPKPSVAPPQPPGSTAPGGDPGSPATGAPMGSPATNGNGTKIGSLEPSSVPASAAAAAVRARRQAMTHWWLALLGTAVVVGLGFMWRLRRSAAAELAEPAGPDSRASSQPATFDRGVEEIWAAAAMLGEAVGRLRQTERAEQTSAPPPVDRADDEGTEGVKLDDVFVLDEQDPLDALPAPPVVASPVGSKPRPDELACHLRAADPTRAMVSVLSVLGDDPRVLRRPQPTVVVSADGLDIHFAVLPALPAGERSQLRQRLADAVA